MAIESIAEESQAANPRIYAALARQAAYQVESIAIALRGVAAAQTDNLDTLVISSSIRLRDLSGALMAMACGTAGPDEALKVWGDTIDSFAASLSEEVLVEGPTMKEAA